MNAVNKIATASLAIAAAVIFPRHCQAGEKYSSVIINNAKYEWGTNDGKLQWRVGDTPWRNVVWNRPNYKTRSETEVKDFAVYAFEYTPGVYVPFLVIIGGDNTVWWRAGFSQDDDFFREGSIRADQFKWEDGSVMEAKQILSVENQYGFLSVYVSGNDGGGSKCVCRQQTKSQLEFTRFSHTN
jgi:hypothetical protein